MIYYIYHIAGIKIGCTNNIERRMYQQGFTDWEILEEHTDIIEASNREIQLQQEHGYEVDNTPYNIVATQFINKTNNRSTWANGDQAARGRMNKGNVRKDLTNINKTEKRHLTFEQAEEIRSKYIPRKYTYSKLGKEYGVSEGVIKRICLNLSYTTP